MEDVVDPRVFDQVRTHARTHARTHLCTLARQLRALKNLKNLVRITTFAKLSSSQIDSMLGRMLEVRFNI